MALLGLAAAGGAWLIFKPANANAATPGTTPKPGSSSKPAGGGSSTSKPTSKPTSELSEDMKRQMAEALGLLGVHPLTGKLAGTADANAIRQATQLCGTLEAMGFKQAAADLRKYVDEAAKQVQTPAEAAPIAAAAPAGLTPEQREYVARVLSLEREPNKIGLLIDWLKKLAPSPERDGLISMAQALALQLAAAQSTAATMAQIDEVIRSPGIAEVQQAASQPLPTPPHVPIQKPQVEDPNLTSKPSVTTSPGQPIPGQKPTLPETPAIVPSKPVPQPVPVPANPAELAAKLMVQNLLATQKTYGVAGAKGKEDKNLVKKFQTASGAVPDGMAGPATLILAAGKGAVDLPLVYYWPKTATTSTVAQYRDSLERIAAKFQELGRATDAATLRASAAREKGQGGVSGGATTAAKPTAKTVATNPSPAKKPVDEVQDPRPDMPLLKQGSRDAPGSAATGKNYVAQWQGVLIRGGFLPDTAASRDGVFGGGTTAATRALQKKAGMIPSAQDGAVGPNTRKAANYLRLW